MKEKCLFLKKWLPFEKCSSKMYDLKKQINKAKQRKNNFEIYIEEIQKINSVYKEYNLEKSIESIMYDLNNDDFKLTLKIEEKISKMHFNQFKIFKNNNKKIIDNKINELEKELEELKKWFKSNKVFYEKCSLQLKNKNEINYYILKKQKIEIKKEKRKSN